MSEEAPNWTLEKQGCFVFGPTFQACVWMWRARGATLQSWKLQTQEGERTSKDDEIRKRVSARNQLKGRRIPADTASVQPPVILNIPQNSHHQQTCKVKICSEILTIRERTKKGHDFLNLDRSKASSENLGKRRFQFLSNQTVSDKSNHLTLNDICRRENPPWGEARSSCK